MNTTTTRLYIPASTPPATHPPSRPRVTVPHARRHTLQDTDNLCTSRILDWFTQANDAVFSRWVSLSQVHCSNPVTPIWSCCADLFKKVHSLYSHGLGRLKHVASMTLKIIGLIISGLIVSGSYIWSIKLVGLFVRERKLLNVTSYMYCF